MKKLAAAAICAALALSLAGCSGNTTVEKQTQDDSSTRMVSDTGGIYCAVITDTETGVQYLYAKNLNMNGAGLVPLLNADGTPYVEGSNNAFRR